MQEVVFCARAASSPGPNGVPYRVYKGAHTALKYVWISYKLTVTVWKKGSIPKMWHRAGGIFFPKERNAMTIGQFQFIRKERKIFFSVVAWRLLSYLKVDSLIDISVRKAGIPGFPRCMERSSMIWHQFQAATIEGRDLGMVFLDLANAYGSVLDAPF